MNETRDKWLLGFLSYVSNKSKSELKAEKRDLESKLLSYLTLDLKPGDLSSLGRAFTTLYDCDSLGLTTTVGKCCDLLKIKEESNSPSIRRNVLHILGCLYGKCGQAGGAMVIEVIQTVSKVLRFPEVSKFLFIYHLPIGV
jgi:hypothetical protein